MQAHDVVRRLVQDQGEPIELHHLMESAGQVMEQRGQIAVRNDRLRNGQQGSVRVASGRCLSVQVSLCHAENPVCHQSGTIRRAIRPDVKVVFTRDILPFFKIVSIVSDHWAKV